MMEDDLSVYDEDESLFGDNASVDDSEAGSLIGAREDVKLMNVVRAIVILILLTIAFISAETVFVIATISEQDQFRDAYSDATGKLVEGFLADLNNKLLTARSFSTELSSSAKGQSWPNVSFDDFEVRSAAPLRMSKSSVISFSPIVMADESDAWESYAVSVYDASVATQRSLVPASPHLANVSSGVAYYPTNRVVGEGIYAFNGTKTVDTHALYSLPIWQMCPTFGNATTGLVGTLFDQAGNRARELALDLMFVRGGCSMSTFLYQDTNGTDYANYSLPRSVINYPVFKNLSSIGVGGEPAGDIAASLNFEFRWEPVLSGILFDYDAPLSVVVQNECGEAFTYTVTGAKAVYVGQGAIYDKSVDGYSPTNTSYDGFDVLFAAHGGASIGAENSCSYKLNVYATSAFKKAYLGQNPGLYKGIVLGFFLVLVLIFIGFDCMIDRSTKHVIQAAERSDKIVRSLFPEAIRDRLYEDAIRKEQQQRTDKNHWKNDGSTVVAAKHKLKTLLDEENPDSDDLDHHDTEPIADFFPNCTVLFADLAGFTAWSSEREPTQVFTLLEQIYRVMDKVAKKLKVFKVETVGDCYVAATGLPVPQDKHVILMARFARTCIVRISELTKHLESTLGPGTGELAMRVGIHSGSVTAGVLRGQKARFQLFGDTMNMAARMESTGAKNKVQLSADTAKLLISSGHQNWVIPRAEPVLVKGKGECQTFWLALGSSTGSHTGSTASDENSDANGGRAQRRTSHKLTGIAPVNLQVSGSSSWAGTIFDGILGVNEVDDKLSRLIDWNVEVLVGLLKRIVARCVAAEAVRGKIEGDEVASQAFESMTSVGAKMGTARDEIKMVVSLPGFDKRVVEIASNEQVTLEPQVVNELREYVTAIASGYKSENEFHNFEHASHVILSSNKLMKRIVAPSEVGLDQKAELTAREVYDYTYGISNDPLTQFAVVFAALVHDVGHPGVPNNRMAIEEPLVSGTYKGKSLAEQRSIDIAWQLLMLPRFENLRRCIYATKTQCLRFRALLVNSVMATDIFDKDLKTIREDRWDRAFHMKEQQVTSDLTKEDIHRKATIVIEHIIQASDVAHTMQHWHIYVKWNERLFREMYFAFLQGRVDKDPSEGWYGGEIWFYDNYVLPLAGKLRECGVFGVSSDEYLTYAQQNRFEWERKGHDIVAGMKAKAVKDAKKMGILIEMETVEEDEGSDAVEDSNGPNVPAVQIAENDKDTDEAGHITPSNDANSKAESPAPSVVDSSPSAPSKGRRVNVPAGRLGITIDTAKGSPIIYSVDSNSPVAGMLKAGDVILAIDDVETTSMMATEIAELIAAKAGHERRFIIQKGNLLRRFSLK